MRRRAEELGQRGGGARSGAVPARPPGATSVSREALCGRPTYRLAAPTLYPDTDPASALAPATPTRPPPLEEGGLAPRPGPSGLCRSGSLRDWLRLPVNRPPSSDSGQEAGVGTGTRSPGATVA